MTKPENDRGSARRITTPLAAALLAVLLSGAALRAAWLGCGLPEIDHVDAFKFIETADIMARTGSFEPLDFQHPALFVNLLAVSYKTLHLTASPLAEAMTARAICALFGVVLIPLVWLAGRPFLSRPSALTAATLAAVSVILVTLSRFPMTDIVLTCFMTAGLICLLQEEPRAGHIAGAGVFLGLAAATKWTGLYLAMFAAALAVARAVKRRAPLREGGRFGAVMLIAAAAFLLAFPQFILHWREYSSSLLIERQTQMYGQIGRVQQGWFDYFISSTPTWEMPWLPTSLLGAMGPVFLAAALLGWARAVLPNRPPGLRAHALYAAAYLALIAGPGHIKAVRFLAPVLPSLFILCGSAMDWAVARFSPAPRRAVYIVAALALLALPAERSFRYVAAARRPMTQFLAEDWLRAHVPPGAGLFVSPFFLGNLWDSGHNVRTFSRVAQYRTPGFPDYNVELNQQYRPQLMDELRGIGIKYVISGSSYDGALLPIPENLRWFPRGVAAYAGWRRRLEAESELAWSVRAADSGRLGPDIEIRRLRVAQGSRTGE